MKAYHSLDPTIKRLGNDHSGSVSALTVLVITPIPGGSTHFHPPHLIHTVRWWLSQRTTDRPHMSTHLHVGRRVDLRIIPDVRSFPYVVSDPPDDGTARLYGQRWRRVWYRQRGTCKTRWLSLKWLSDWLLVGRIIIRIIITLAA